MNIFTTLGRKSSSGVSRKFSVSSISNATQKCKLLVIGGGTGGCTIAAKFARRLKLHEVFVLEPSIYHYYQPLWTLVGAGVKTMADTRRRESTLLPTHAKWVQEGAASIDPNKCIVQTTAGNEIHYEYLVVALGLKNDYEKIPGLLEALTDEKSGVSTIYSADYAEKTWQHLKEFKSGEAIFTFPDSPIKCPGAPQKIAYLADSYMRMTGARARANISFNTSLPVIFGVKKYADALVKVVERKKIKVNYKTVLKELRHDKKEATFCSMDDKTKTTTVPFDFLHVTPPMSPPEVLRGNNELTDLSGFLDVDKFTLQHKTYTNVYGIGDCTNTPNSKTAAAIAKQCLVLELNLLSTMKSDQPHARYDGYGACPLLTEYGKCILAEFIYDGVPHETMPFDQARESTVAYHMKKELFPFLYWNVMMKGYYHGPEFVRRIVNPLSKN